MKRENAYAPEGFMPLLFLWLSPELQEERVRFLSRLGRIPFGADESRPV